VEFDNQPGFYFSGREAVLAELVAFLNSDSDNKTRIITGRPGGGKSAILSRLVNLSVPEYRTRTHLGRETSELAPINLAIHAKGKTYGDVIARFAERLGVEAKPETVFEHLTHSSKLLRVILDALDEAAQPVEIAEQLLRPLSELDSVKLLVGTRTVHVASLPRAEVIDIDRPEYAKEKDIAQYVKARLLRAAEQGQATPYSGKEDIAEQVADLVAKSAYPNFLIARLVIEDLLSRPGVMKADRAEDMAFPTKVSTAFDAYLARFGEKEIAVRDLLLPLAYPEGEGLPWDNIWAPLSSALARRRYGNSDIRWLLENAGAFILETAEDGRSVYRLYHKALADALRKGRWFRRVQAHFVKVLTAAAPPKSDNTGPNWLLSSRYTRSHLATHAGRCGMLAELLNDPLYLLAADPAHLLTAIATQKDEVSRSVAAVYKESVDYVRSCSLAVAASYLELIARQRGMNDFANRLSASSLLQPWHALWAFWDSPIASQFFGKGESSISTLATTNWGAGRLIAAIGRKDGRVEVWDMTVGRLLMQWGDSENLKYVDQIALAETKDGPLVVATWDNGRIGVFSPTTGERILQLDQNPSRITALCVAKRGLQDVCITAHQDSRLVIRDLPNANPILQTLQATKGSIYGLRVVRLKNQSLLFSVGDSHVVSSEEIDLSKLRLWSILDLSLVWQDARGERGSFRYIQQIEAFGQTLTVVSQNGLGPPEIWDLENRRLMFEGGVTSTKSTLYNYQGETLLLNRWLGYLKVQRLLPQTAVHLTSFSASDFGNVIEIKEGGLSDTQIVSLRGRATMLSIEDDHVRLFDVDDIVTETIRTKPSSNPGASQERIGVVSSLATLLARLHEVYVGTERGVFCLDAVTGQIPGQIGLSNVRAISGCQENGWIVAGTRDGSILVFDALSSDTPVRRIEAGSKLERLNVIRWRGVNLVFATVAANDNWKLQVWELATGKEVAHLEIAGSTDKWLYGLVISPIADVLRVAIGMGSWVCVADFDPLTGIRSEAGIRSERVPVKFWRNPSFQDIKCLAQGVDGLEVLVASASWDGDLAVWYLLTGELIASKDEAHRDRVDALCFCRIRGETLLVSGGNEGILRFCTIRLQEVFQIGIGDRIVAITWIEPRRFVIGCIRGVVMLEVSESGYSADSEPRTSTVAGSLS
jgi:WD40 repeat protein